MLTALQRIALLTDLSSFEEVGAPVDGVRTDCAITGIGMVDGRRVAIIATDRWVQSGSISEQAARKIAAMLKKAQTVRIPVIALWESPGARIQEGVVGMHAIAEMFRQFAEISGVVPTIAVLLGTNSGATAYSAALMDFCIMVEQQSHTFITGPKVVEQVLGEQVSMAALGGSEQHGRETGLATIVAASESEAISSARRLLRYLPQHFSDITLTPPQLIRKKSSPEAMMELLPDGEDKCGYDMLRIIEAIVDDDSFLELQAEYAPNLITGFACMGNMVTGIIANQPMCMSGILDIKASRKIARFVQICDAYSIPLIFLADSPGFMPGREQEQQGMVSVGAAVLSALVQARVPKITVIIHKLIGGAYAGMNCKGMGADAVFAWPCAKVAVVGKEAATRVIFHKEIQQSDDPETSRIALLEDYAQQHLHPYVAAEHGQIDAVIHPNETRGILMKTLTLLQQKAERPTARRTGIQPWR